MCVRVISLLLYIFSYTDNKYEKTKVRLDGVGGEVKEEE